MVYIVVLILCSVSLPGVFALRLEGGFPVKSEKRVKTDSDEKSNESEDRQSEENGKRSEEHIANSEEK